MNPSWSECVLHHQFCMLVAKYIWDGIGPVVPLTLVLAVAGRLLLFFFNFYHDILYYSIMYAEYKWLYSTNCPLMCVLAWMYWDCQDTSSPWGICWVQKSCKNSGFIQVVHASFIPLLERCISFVCRKPRRPHSSCKNIAGIWCWCEPTWSKDFWSKGWITALYDFFFQERQGDNALIVASHRGHVGVIWVLIDHGAIINHKNQARIHIKWPDLSTL